MSTIFRLKIPWLLFFLIILLSSWYHAEATVRPSDEYPGYWEYKGEPVLLVGGTSNDNLFQDPDATEELKLLASVGGNYIRNTMSSRDAGNVQPFLGREDGKYDLNQWNELYWKRFEQLLQNAFELDIIVQIEIWDRFDYGPESTNAFVPSMNVNYSAGTGGMDSILPKYRGSDLQPFFHTVNGMPLYSPELDTVRYFQERFVEKVLSYTLKYPHILYCMNNETGTPPEWGQYWLQFVRDKATQQQQEIYATDMFNNFYRVRACEPCMMSVATPDVYQFIDASQINSRHFGQAHWDTLMVVMDLMQEHKRPVNCTKVYGGAETSWGSGTHQDGVERFCRIIMGGVASARFHRPVHGSGLNELSQTAIKAVRHVETLLKWWELSPNMQLLNNREDNEAYCSGNQLGQYVVYFPSGGSVQMELSGRYSLEWIGVSRGYRVQYKLVKSEGLLELNTPDDTGWFVVVK